jgi:exonuclease III
MTGNTTHLLILIPNVNGLDVPIKRHRITNWINKQDPILCCLQETHLTEKIKHWLRAKGWIKIFQGKRPPNQAEGATLISNKVDFRLKSVRRNNEGHFMLIKGTGLIPRWQLDGGSRKRASYSEILERRWRHTLQA